jgi:hypothetical protein
MPQASNGISTRQAGGGFFSTSKPLGPSASIVSDPFLVAGMARIIISGISDQPHEIMVEEANRPEGSWGGVGLAVSSVTPEGLQRAAITFVPIGAYVRVTVRNAGVQQERLSVVTVGLPT